MPARTENVWRQCRAVGWRRISATAAAIGLGANLFAEPLRSLRDWRETDFVVFASAARMVAAGAHCLYCATGQRTAERAYMGVPLPSGVFQPFVNPPAAAWLMQPLASLPPEAALSIFLAGAVACMISACAVAFRQLVPQFGHRLRLIVVLAAVASLPAAYGLALGQWGPYLVLPAILAVVWLEQDRRHIAAGLLLSLALVKPQLVVLVPLALVLTHAWRSLAGFACGAVVWATTTIAILGAHTLDWPALAAGGSSAVASEGLGLPGLGALLSGRAIAAALVSAALTAAVVAAAVLNRHRLRDPAAAVALALAASVLVASHVNADDFILMAPMLLVWARRQPGFALGAGLALSVAFLIDAMVGQPGGAHALTIAGLLAVGGAARSLISMPGGRRARAAAWTSSAPQVP